MFRDYRSYDKLKPHDGCKKLTGFVIALVLLALQRMDHNWILTS
jgi:hypothetical protein